MKAAELQVGEQYAFCPDPFARRTGRNPRHVHHDNFISCVQVTELGVRDGVRAGLVRISADAPVRVSAQVRAAPGQDALISCRQLLMPWAQWQEQIDTESARARARRKASEAARGRASELREQIADRLGVTPEQVGTVCLDFESSAGRRVHGAVRIPESTLRLLLDLPADANVGAGALTALLQAAAP